MTGEDVRKIRGKRTQAVFCRDIGLDSVSTLSRWERGVHKPSKLWEEKLLQFKKGKSNVR